jgi:hypothetical protein
MRLTNAIREDILKKARKGLYAEANALIHTLRNKVSKKVAARVYKEIGGVSNVSETGLQKLAQQFYIQTTKRIYVELEKGHSLPRRLRAVERYFDNLATQHFDNKQNIEILGTTQFPTYEGHHVKVTLTGPQLVLLDTAVEKAETTIKKIRALSGVLYSHNTYATLLEQIPEAEKYLPESDTAYSLVPMADIEAARKLLGGK